MMMKISIVVVLALALSVSAAVPLKRGVQQQGCSLCEFVIQTVESYISSNATEQEILKVLETACTLLPAPYGTQCTSIVEKKGPQIIEWIINKENPQALCQLLTLCPPGGRVNPIEFALRLQPHFRPASSSGCVVCQYVVSVIEGYVDNNATVTKIEKSIEAVCAKLPSGYQAYCDSIAQEIPQIVNWIEQNEQPLQVCQQLSLC